MPRNFFSLKNTIKTTICYFFHTKNHPMCKNFSHKIFLASIKSITYQLACCMHIELSDLTSDKSRRRESSAMPGEYQTTAKGREIYTYVPPTRDNGCPVTVDGKECRMRVYIAEGKVHGALQLSQLTEFVGRRMSMSRKKRKTQISGDWETKSNISPTTLWVFSYPVTATRRERRRVFESVIGWLDSKGIRYESRHVESLVVGGVKIAAQHSLDQKHRAILTKGNPKSN